MLSADDKTTVTVGKEKKTLADVKVGAKVTVKYVEMDGKNVAKSIAIVEAKEEKAKAAEPAAPAKPATPAVPAKPATPAEPAKK